MRNSLIITKQELLNRIRSRFFWIMLIIGPFLVLSSIYTLFKLGDEGKKKINVLVSDEGVIFNQFLLSKDSANIHYDCINKYVSLKDFKTKSEFQKYDALIDINHKVLENKDVLVLHREKPSSQNKIYIRYDIEKRLEEVIAESKNFSINDYNSIKQPIGIKFRDIHHPEGKPDLLPSWAGFGFSAIIFLFVLLYGMSVLRSITKDKSTRIVEVILSSTRPSELLYGKIFGVGLAAIIQFFCWFGIISIGLYALKENWINSFYDPSNVLAGKSHLNELVELIYHRINYQVMVPYFLCFFILGYVFYSSFFSIIGASIGSESDGQQFIFPILSILSLSLFIGYFSIYNPNHILSKFCFYFPFTSPFVALIKISNGISVTNILVSLLVLICSTIFMVKISSRIYKNSILHYGHRLKIWQIIKWIRKA